MPCGASPGVALSLHPDLIELAERAKGSTMYSGHTTRLSCIASCCLLAPLALAGVGDTLNDTTRGNDDGVTNGAPPLVFAYGLPHEPMGQAILTQEAGRLKVSNLGSSGKDGVSIATGGTYEMQMEVDFAPSPQPGTFTVDSFFDIAYQIDFAPQGAGPDAIALLSTGTCDQMAVLVETFLDDQLVDSKVFQNPQPGEVLIVSNIGSSGQDGVRMNLGGLPPGDFNVDSFFDIAYAIDPNGSIGGCPSVGAINRARVSLQACAPPPLADARVTVRCANIPEVFILDEALATFNPDSFFDIDLGPYWRSLGQSQLQSDHDQLTVSNIGSSGQDGVSIDLGDLEEPNPLYPCALALDLQELAPGGVWQCDSFFDITYRIDETSGAGGDISYIGPCDATSSGGGAHVQLYLQGTLVDEAVFPSSANGDTLIVSNIGSSGKDGVRIDLGNILGDDGFTVDSFFDVTYQVSGSAAIAGHAAVTADQIFIRNISCVGPPQGTSNEPQVVKIRTTNPTIEVLGATLAMPAPCPWDCAPAGGNGQVNIDDLLAVINSFGDPGGPCDNTPLNPDGTFGNGIVNIDDLLAVINNFGPCP
ncbi:MAG: hypothetical protein AAF432_07085 [Planctomycetota bacterium]